MVSKNASLLTVAAIAGLLVLSGCGRSAPQMARPIGATAKSGNVAARGVAPDKVFANDLRRARYWGGDNVVHVMAIHTTFGNSTRFGASANVFYSPDAAQAGKTSVFVARHYGLSPMAQYTEIKDYNGLAAGLKPIVNFASASKAEAAWLRVKKFVPAPGPSAPPTEHVREPLLLNTMAFLTQGEGSAATWSFYTGKRKFTVDALTGELNAPQLRVDPNDRLNMNDEASLQRAAAIWLPNKSTTNRQDQPSPSS